MHGMHAPDLHRCVLTEEQMEMPEYVLPELSELIQSMTKLDPEERPEIEDVDVALSLIFEKLTEAGQVTKFLGSE
jgi:hypothetical protein